MHVQQMYERRFSGELEFRRAMWRVLCRDFFQRYIPRDGCVLEIAAGYCEFINQIQCARKVALDINPDVQLHAAEDVEVILTSTTDMRDVTAGSIDVVFASNFFEHLTRPDILTTLAEVFRVLRPGGTFLVLQPNIRFCGNDFWMFFDHITPIDDRAFVEALEIKNFEVLQVVDRFLPFTTKSGLPRSAWLVRLYLRVPLVWRFLGQQSFFVSRRPL